MAQSIPRAELSRQQSFVWQPSENAEPWWSLQRSADYIGMSGDKLKQLADQHAVEAYRLGNQLRFKRSALDKLLKKV